VRTLPGILLAIGLLGADPGRVAIVIGVDPYLYLAPLRAAENDARLMGPWLASNGFNVQTFLGSSPDLARRPTRSVVLRQLENLAARSAEEPPSQVVFYFAGHGCAIAGVNYLCFPDADVQVESGMLSIDTDLLPALRRIDAGQTIVLLDACRENVTLTRSARTRGLSISELPRRERGGGIFIVYAARPGGFSLEKKDGSHGYFTEQVLRGLSLPALDTLDALSRWLRATVADLTEKETGYAQVPFIGGDFDPAATFRLGAPAGRAPSPVTPPPAAPLPRFIAPAVDATVDPSERRPRVAILPIHCESVELAQTGEKIQALLRDALAEVPYLALRGNLAGPPDPWTACLPKDWRRLAKELGAEVLVAPSVVASPKKVRLILTFIDHRVGEAILDQSLASESVHEWEEKVARMVGEFRRVYRDRVIPKVEWSPLSPMGQVRGPAELVWSPAASRLLLAERGKTWELDPETGSRSKSTFSEEDLRRMRESSRQGFPPGDSRLERDPSGAWQLIAGSRRTALPVSFTPEYTTLKRALKEPHLIGGDTVLFLAERSQGEWAPLAWFWKLGVGVALEPSASALAPLPGGRLAAIQGDQWHMVRLSILDPRSATN